VPFVTGWMGQNHFAPVPTAAYGGVLLMAAVAYTVLLDTLLACQQRNARLRAAIGRDGKGKLSLALYLASIPLAFIDQRFSDLIFVTVALIWLVPDRRIERRVHAAQP